MDIIDAGLGNITLESPTYIKQVSYSNKYAPKGGFPAVLDAIASYEHVSPDEVTITTGASMGIVSALSLLPKSSIVLLPRPYYPSYVSMVTNMGLIPSYYDLKKENNWRPHVEELRKLITNVNPSAIIWNFPHNPTGSVPLAEDLIAVKKLFNDSRALIIIDEVYGDFIYDKVLLLLVKNWSKGITNSLVIKSFSKTFGIPGERLGYVIGKPETVAKVKDHHWTFCMSAPSYAQLTALNLLADAPIKRVTLLRDMLKSNRDYALSKLQNITQLHCPDAGIFLWIPVMNVKKISSTNIVQELHLQWNLITVPGRAFGQNNEYYIRASFGIPQTELIESCDRLINYLIHITE